MAIYRVYSGDDGHSHVEEMRVGVHAAIADALSARQVSFHEVEADHYDDWHQQPERVVFVVLQGQIKLGFRNGSAHRANPGDATLVEDMTGSGHNFRVSSDTPAVTAVIRLEG